MDLVKVIQLGIVSLNIKDNGTKKNTKNFLVMSALGNAINK